MVVLALGLGSGAEPVRAQQSEPAKGGPSRRVVAATVDGEPIFLGEVEREVARVVNSRPVQPAARRLLQAQALEQLIGRRLILRYLDRKGLGATDQDVALALERAKKRLGQQRVTLQQYLARSGLTEAEFRRTLQWQLGWQRYLDRYLTDQNLRNYFEKNRRQFDGTQVRAAHILLKVDPTGGEDQWQAALEKAKRIRAEILSGRIDFARAARIYSEAPSARQGGDIGLIGRHQPMPESFSRAAFQLEQGEVSRPVISPFGVHLIRCLKIQPGQKQWQDVRQPLKTALTRYLFQWVADQERPKAIIRYTGNVPHFKPGTHELAD